MNRILTPINCNIKPAMDTTRQKLEDLESSVVYLTDQNITLRKQLNQTNLTCHKLEEKMMLFGGY